MIILILLSCFTIIVSAVPVRPNVVPPLLSRGGDTQAQRVVEATNQQPDTQTLAPLCPNVEQAQSGVQQQPGPQAGPQFLPPTQYHTWPPLGGSPMIIPQQPSVYGSQPANQPTLPHQPLIFPPYRYFPVFSSPHRNQIFPQYRFPMILESPFPQTPANQPPNSPVLPAETLSGAAPGDAAQTGQQQQQNPQIIYIFQQPKSSLLGSLSSEEFQVAAKLGQLGVYLDTVLTNPPAGAVQHEIRAAGLANIPTGIIPTVGTSLSGVLQTQGLASSGPQPNTNGLPAGLKRPVQEAATVQTSVQSKLQPTQGNLV
ncbi:leukocyte receptor cluster member 8 homolog [Sander lucioperca]|uniref:leukocyte receptor cluster member 8 homolog n=1 Tax=Sander lucioperca TaxID=283035 RepID=UPI00125E447B|nr:leukocyte receptor cluster member 8 homolog [Sander lucioperca]